MTSALLTRTKAEEAFVASFDQVARRGTAGAVATRQAALARLAEIGLPHRRIEEWKYTDLRNAVKEGYPPAEPIGAAVTETMLASALGPLAALDAMRLVFVDGYFAQSLSTLPAVSPTVTIASRGDAMAMDQIRPLRGSGLDGVLALNDAFATDGAVIKVSADPGKPVLVVFLHRATAPRRVTTRNAIEVSGGAAVEVIEAHCRLGQAALQTSTTMGIDIAAGSKLSHVKVLMEGSLATHLGHADILVGERARYDGFQLTAGAGLARNETHIKFSGPDAAIDLSGVFLGRDNDHIDTTLVVEHSTLGCESRELFKGVLDGRARGVFQGKVIVQPQAQQTDGKQMARALMLSEDAEFCSKPELEIYADDVACGHGTTAAEIDPGMLFYLRSRGIPKAEARALLIESFVGEALEKIDNEPLRDAMIAIAGSWLAAAAPDKA